ncbi:DUF1697 domain-containing protein [Lactiplantibacillus daoliensis]|uniref:DUF1697 domain-containing protein n=1 Tax=Lactiplantibacillus daoliensis TaxID=2559916 RepID=A0ABW1UFZ9_9LACO|nr:DUF1697 domain-containing protein [Lactiplantibacillus daoliensis]
MTYLLLLRGVNVGGNHRVPMATLRELFTVAGCTQVHSYINSGNLFFTSGLARPEIEALVMAILTTNFDFPIDFRVLTETEFKADLALAPSWWGADATLRHNALFKLQSYDRAHDDWLPTKLTAYDQVLITPNIIFWTSTLRVNYSKSFYSKLLGTLFYQQTSARNFNTTMKLAQLFEP